MITTRRSRRHPQFCQYRFSASSRRPSACCPIFLAKDANTGEFYAARAVRFQGKGSCWSTVRTDGKAAFRPLDLIRQELLRVGREYRDRPVPVRVSGPARPFASSTRTASPPTRCATSSGPSARSSAATATKAFIQEMLSLKLVEPIDISLSFDDGEELTLDGLYTVSREALMDLDDATVLRLYRNWYIQAAWCMAFSLDLRPRCSPEAPQRAAWRGA